MKYGTVLHLIKTALLDLSYADESRMLNSLKERGGEDLY